ncbi:carboxypeptidase-like regulatory domain-containing protein [uncultured Proteiniphilum sp.]|uniref:carboxypeptidase-like regulatory domain-containing protein n=1 Tax=uncultured Proteiniphilum sp. TaxID=497637 RepID=UPI00344F952F
MIKRLPVKIKLIFILLFNFAFLSFPQQTYNIKGRITDENGHPFSNISLFLPISKTGTITNNDGLFSLNFSGNEENLRVSFIGYETQSVNINKIFRIH